MNKRTCKEIDLQCEHNAFKVRYGTLNKKLSKSVYINIETQIAPINEESMEGDVQLLMEECRSIGKSLVRKNNAFKTRTIIDTYISNKKLEKDKKTHFNFEMYLIPVDESAFMNDKLMKNVREVSDKMIKEIVNVSNTKVKLISD